MFWLDPFFWLFVGMVVLDVGILLYGLIRVRLFLRSMKSLPSTVQKVSNGLQQEMAALSGQSLQDRLREYQNRPLGTSNHSE